MDRRAYLATAAAMVPVAGCLGVLDNGGSSDDEANSDDGGSEDTGGSEEATGTRDGGGSGAGGNSGDDSDGSDEEDEPAEPDIQSTIQAPETVELGEPFEIVLEFENVGDAPGETPPYLWIQETGWVEPEPNLWERYGITTNVAPGETETVRREFTLDYPSRIYYRLDEDSDPQYVEAPPSTAPIITDGSLVSEWEGYGDREEHAIESAEVGENILIAFGYWYYLENQTLEVFRQISIYDEDGERVTIDSDQSEQIFETDQWSHFEVAMRFRTTGWDPGTYEAEILIRDEQTGEVSGRETVEFDLV